MRKKRILSIIIVTLFMFTLLSACGSKDTGEPAGTEAAEAAGTVAETETLPEAEPEPEPEEPEIEVTAQELWDNAWNDVESVTVTETEEVDLTVKRGIVPSYRLKFGDFAEDQEEFNYKDKLEYIEQMMKGGSTYIVTKYTTDEFEYSDEEFDSIKDEYYNIWDDRVLIEYMRQSDDVWTKDIYDYTDDEDFDEEAHNKFIADEPRDLEIISETDTEWLVSGIVTRGVGSNQFNLLFEPEPEDSNYGFEWKEIDVHVTYTFDKEIGYLLKAEYNFEDIYNYFKTEFFEEGVISVNTLLSINEYTDHNNSAFEMDPEITENCMDYDEYLDQLFAD